jgi:hypothetical protein
MCSLIEALSAEHDFHVFKRAYLCSQVHFATDCGKHGFHQEKCAATDSTAIHPQTCLSRSLGDVSRPIVVAMAFHRTPADITDNLSRCALCL